MPAAGLHFGKPLCAEEGPGMDGLNQGAKVPLVFQTIRLFLRSSFNPKPEAQTTVG